MFKLIYTDNFWRKYRKITKKDKNLKLIIANKLTVLGDNPFNKSLKSHKANSKHYGICWSSRITGDIRVIWDFDRNKKLIILVISLGTHSGRNKIYK